MQDLVLIGGGHSHAIALKLWGENPLPGVRLWLVSDVELAPYSGMLPGYVAGAYSESDCHIALRPLAEFAKAHFIRDRVVGLDLAQQQVLCSHHPPLSFDLLSINIGSTPARSSVPGTERYVVPAKPVPQFLAAWQALLAQVMGAPHQPLSLGIVGGGAGGVELALAMHSHLGQLLQCAQQPLEHLAIHLFHRGEEVMSGHNAGTRRKLQRLLQQRDIQLHLQETVSAIAPGISPQLSAVTGEERPIVQCQSGLTVACDRIFWVTQASAPGWPNQAGLATTDRGFIQVQPTLQSCSHANVFAAGDIATMVQSPRPKAGVFAVRQGKPLFQNWQRFLQRQPLHPYQPQKRFLTLIGTGQNPAIAPASQAAVASWGPFSWHSPLAWQWKDWIDRKFMQQFVLTEEHSLD